MVLERPRRIHKAPIRFCDNESYNIQSANNLNHDFDAENGTSEDEDIATNSKASMMSSVPDYVSASSAPYKYIDLNHDIFEEFISSAYEEIIRWRKNTFVLPLGKPGQKFIKELAHLIHSFANAAAMERIALKAAMVFQSLMLQKTGSKDGASNRRNLARRLEQWLNGDVESLLKEGLFIQKTILKAKRSKACGTDEKFQRLVSVGKVRQAAQLLKQNCINGLHNIDDTIDGTPILDILKDKHPVAKPAAKEALLNQTGYNRFDQSYHPVLFDGLTAATIKKVVLSMKSSSGPSGIDALGWGRFCTMFGDNSLDLCEAIAATGRRLATEYIEPSSVEALVAGRIVPLNKNPGVRPIGIGETLRRIICKAIILKAKHIITEVVGVDQLCTGIESGCEAGVSAARKTFLSDDTKAMLFVDASNAFNSLNREAMLHNIHITCPAIAPIVTNLYRNSSVMAAGSEKILSEEGTTQGDPLSMPLYALSTLPLIKSIARSSVRQIWYADDACVGGSIQDVCEWWRQLSSDGPKYGYFPNPSKSWLLVKEEYLEDAKKIFEDTSLNITCTGRPYLGSAIGTEEYIANFVRSKVNEWETGVETLSKIAETQPQAAYCVFCKSIASEWNYLTRTTPCAVDDLQPLETAVRTKFLPRLLEIHAPSDSVRKLLALPIRMGGMAILDPTTLDSNFEQSQMVTAPLVDAIMSNSNSSLMPETKNAVFAAKRIVRSQRAECLATERDDVIGSINESLKRAANLAAEKGASNWLSVIPMAAYGFVLHKRSFRDAVSLRYGWKPKGISDACVCGADNDIAHAFSCPVGGYPILRHNEVRDSVASLLQETCCDVCVEPSLQPVTRELLGGGSSIEDRSRLDVAAGGFYGCKYERTYFDIRVFNPFVQSNMLATMEAVYSRHEREKRRRYERRVTQIERASFIPFVMACTGGYGRAAQEAVKRIALMMAEKKKVKYSHAVSWIRTKLSFAILRTAIMCLRGSKHRRDVNINANAMELELAQVS